MKIQPEIYQVTIETPYVSSESTAEEFNKLQDKYKGFDFITLSEFNEDEKYSRNLIKNEKLVLSKDQIADMALNNIALTVHQKIKIDIDITQQLIELAEKPIKLIQENNEGSTYNSKCEVHMPGHSLSMYNDMMLKEDCCTDEIQSTLNSGWRIVAVCPQPDQRRPDYILGRFNPNQEVRGDAER